MPVLLPRLSRRAFLQRTALAGTSLALANSGHAGWFGKSRDRHTFAFLSDAHIAADPKTVHSEINMADHLSACVQQIGAWPVKPAAILVTGDLAFQHGAPADYVTFGQRLQPLRALAPIHLTLGNHDEREHFWQAFPHDATPSPTLPPRQASWFASGGVNWFLLDSLDVTAQTPGRVGAPQLEWLDGALTAQRHEPAIIVCHHPLDPTGFLGLQDTPAMEELFAQHRQVKAFIFGHTHNWNVARHASGVHLINLPQTAYAFLPGRPSGWVRATLSRTGMEVELRCLDPQHPEHGQVARLNWRTA